MHPTTAPIAGVGPPAQARPAQTCPTCGAPARHRSDEHHRLFFAVIKQVFDNWPEHFEQFQPRDAEHLRAWLLIEAGWYREREFVGPKNLIAETIRGFQEFTDAEDCRAFPTKKGLRLRVAKSMKYRECPKRDFEKVSARVFEITEAITGVSVEDWKQQAKRGT